MPLVGVLECQALKELIEAGLGLGASQNGTSIRAKLPQEGEEIALACARTPVKALPQAWQDRVRMHPYVPSLAYRIAMVARGDIAGTFIRPNSNDWDLAAADLILSEAGGAIRTAENKPLTYGGDSPLHGALVASSGSLLQDMLSVVAEQGLG